MASAYWTISFFVIVVIIFSGVTRAQLNIEEEKAVLIASKSDSAEEEEKDYCEEICGNILGVECNGDKSKKEEITCSCEDGDQIFDPSDKKCKDDNCLKDCGIPHGEKDNDELICDGKSPFGNVSCKCKDKEMSFDAGDKDCKVDYCYQKCGSIECHGNKFEEDEVKCLCPEDFQDFIEDEKRCKANYCKKVCGTAEGVVCEGDEYKIKTSKDCGCDDDEYAFYYKKCQKKCLDDIDCEHDGICGNSSKLCICKPGTSGDMCEIITDCESGRYKTCTGEKGECGFEDGKALCKCPEDKQLYEKLGHCEDHCIDYFDCQGNRDCNEDKFCVCKDGYEGDDCDVITGCKILAEKCTEIDAECVFDFNVPEKASCICKRGYIYDRDNNVCQHSYCYPNNPCKDGECVGDNNTYNGYCKCSEDMFYNYKTEKCEELPDKCLLKKTPCKQNEVCSNGECKCKYGKEDDECQTFCSTNPCFDNAKCSDDDGMCYCEEGQVFTGRSCENATCDFKEFKTKCPCPADTVRVEEDEECVPTEDKEACSRDCGYGVCILENDKEVCKCFSFASFLFGSCRFNEHLCPGITYDGMMRCFCSREYAGAADGITCRLKTCEEDDVRKDCASRGAVCKMNWQKLDYRTPIGYYCECPKGYEMDETGKCTDPCSIEKNIVTCAKHDQFCYNSPTNASSATTCVCPPIFQVENDKCTKKAYNVYLISNITVLKKNYETQSGINKVLLNSDLIQSMESTFSLDLFDYGYLSDYRIIGDTINCSIWINFKKQHKKIELERIELVPKQFSNVCDDCDENVVVWPPNLLLSKDGLQHANVITLSFCSNEVKDLICGKGTVCNRFRECVCADGFKLIGNSFREIGYYKVQRCEDIDECETDSSNCTENTTCVNTLGSYKCVCKEGFKKENFPEDPETDKTTCYDMCTPSPCLQGKCILKGKTFDCQCQPGYGGPLCDRRDENYYGALKNTGIVGSVLGLLLIAVSTAFLYYILKMREKYKSGDFVNERRTPQNFSPEVNNTEMMERENIQRIGKPFNVRNPNIEHIGQRATYVPTASR